jgi:DNA-binding NarL/FixJ family response regulator
MGGGQIDVQRDAARRVVLCLSDARLGGELTSALERAGFHIETHQDLARASFESEPPRPVVVVLDDRQHDWLRTVVDLTHAHPEIRPVVLADIESAEQFLAALMGGVVGFCRADASVAAIVRTIETVDGSGVAIPRDMVGPLVAQVRHGRGHRLDTIAGPIDVTDREWEILQLMMQRRSTREIADAVFVSVGTVRSHVAALVRKVGAVDRDDLVQMVERSARRR